MRTVTFKSVQQKASALLTNKVTPNTDDGVSLNIFINARYREYLERFYWPELMLVEQRTFRPAYVGTSAYAASTTSSATEVYYWPTGAYYQCLRAARVTINTIIRSGTTATVDFGAVHYLTTGHRVQISGASPAGYNGTWTITVTGSTSFTYTMAADPGSSATGTLLCGVHPADASGQAIATYWAVSERNYSASDWSTAAYTAASTQIVYQPQDGRYYQCILAHTNAAPPNATYWGVLTDFERDIDFTTGNQGTSATSIGEVRTVWDGHPWRDEGACPLAFVVTSDGIVVYDIPNVVWVEFRIRPNEFTGAAHVVGTNYVAGDQVYYSTTGEYYRNIVATNSALPTDTTKWTKLDFPYVLAPAVAQAAYADQLKVTGKTSKWGEEIKESLRMLQREFDKIERQQGQSKGLNVQLR